MYHPMRAAEAAYWCASAELALAEVEPHRPDHAVNGAARTVIEAADAMCFHDRSQALQHCVADILRGAGRTVEAAQWQAEADRYEDWEWFADQQIPGHVHLWDIRPDG